MFSSCLNANTILSGQAGPRISGCSNKTPPSPGPVGTVKSHHDKNGPERFKCGLIWKVRIAAISIVQTDIYIQVEVLKDWRKMMEMVRKTRRDGKIPEKLPHLPPPLFPQ